MRPGRERQAGADHDEVLAAAGEVSELFLERGQAG